MPSSLNLSQSKVESIEFAEMELEVFKRLKEGNAVLNEIHSVRSMIAECYF